MKTCPRVFRIWAFATSAPECLLQRRHSCRRGRIGRHLPDRVIERLDAHRTVVPDLLESAEERLHVDQPGGRRKLALAVHPLILRNPGRGVIEIDRYYIFRL